MKTYLKIHKDDNVAVALSPLKEGTKVIIDDQEITLKEDIPQGHKFALTDINKDQIWSTDWFGERINSNWIMDPHT